MKRSTTISLCAALALLPVQAKASTVQAQDYSAFWLWSGVKPKPGLEQAQELFLLAGEVTSRGVVSQRGATPHIHGSKVWIVYRVDTLDWGPDTSRNILNHVLSWRAAGNDVVGLQIDFDSGTRVLAGYIAFLKKLRSELPPDLKLGITGLLDWGANAKPEDLAALSTAVDEVILQTYQGRHVIPNYQTYLERLQKLNVPFRIGLLDQADWQAPANLAGDKMFKGYVVFLVNAAGR